MSKPAFPEWLKSKCRHKGKYVDNRFGDLAKNLSSVMRRNPFEEDFNSYNTLEDWLIHLDIHLAPRGTEATMLEAWELYVNEGLIAEVDYIKGEDNENTNG